MLNFWLWLFFKLASCLKIFVIGSIWFMGREVRSTVMPRKLIYRIKLRHWSKRRSLIILFFAISIGRLWNIWKFNCWFALFFLFYIIIELILFPWWFQLLNIRSLFFIYASNWFFLSCFVRRVIRRLF